MKTMRLFLGIAIIVIAIAVAVVPQFTNCEHYGREMITAAGTSVPMKCYWSAQAEIVIGAVLLTAGILILVGRRKESALFLSIITAVSGAFAILIPTMLIGVCSSMMPCNTFMRPFLVVMGVLVIALSILGLVIFSASKERKA